jgi:hypothetical protein
MYVLRPRDLVVAAMLLALPIIGAAQKRSDFTVGITIVTPTKPDAISTTTAKSPATTTQTTTQTIPPKGTVKYDGSGRTRRRIASKY